MGWQGREREPTNHPLAAKMRRRCELLRNAFRVLLRPITASTHAERRSTRSRGLCTNLEANEGS
eukprot:7906354-Prorocentrum_lima.AAC.1